LFQSAPRAAREANSGPINRLSRLTLLTAFRERLG
jgi:hypothetical protein